jgi:hypothetical protein
MRSNSSPGSFLCYLVLPARWISGPWILFLPKQIYWACFLSSVLFKQPTFYCFTASLRRFLRPVSFCHRLCLLRRFWRVLASRSQHWQITSLSCASCCFLLLVFSRTSWSAPPEWLSPSDRSIFLLVHCRCLINSHKVVRSLLIVVDDLCFSLILEPSDQMLEFFCSHWTLVVRFLFRPSVVWWNICKSVHLILIVEIALVTFYALSFVFCCDFCH